MGLRSHVILLFAGRTCIAFAQRPAVSSRRLGGFRVFLNPSSPACLRVPVPGYGFCLTTKFLKGVVIDGYKVEIRYGLEFGV